MHIVDGEFCGDHGLQEAVRALGYASSAHAVLHRSVFPPPSIVAEVGTSAIVNAVRRGTFPGLGRIERMEFIEPQRAETLFSIQASDPSARGIYVDDNACPFFAFMSCFTVGRHLGSTQLSHVFPREYSQHPRYFTSLPNLVLVPAWLAKLTDVDDSVMQTLRWAVRLVYGFCPEGDGAADHQCPICEMPTDAPPAETVRTWVGAHEHLRVKDYRTTARSRRDKRWKNAIEAGRGYGHVLLSPT